MKNRIDALVKKGLADEKAFDEELNALAESVEKDPKLYKELRKEFDESLAERGRKIKELSIRMQLEDISEVVNLSYIARHYFKRSKQWFMQRINGYYVNGKPAKFTPQQLDVLNNALQDVSKRIGSVSVS